MNKVYLITGVTSDLAMAFLRKLETNINEGKIVVYGTYNRNVDLANELKESLTNIELRPIKCDLSIAEDIDSLIHAIGDDVPTHFIHLAAKKMEYMRVRDFDWEKVKREIDVQVGSFGLIAKWLLPLMAKNNYGRILAIGSSVTNGVPPRYLSNYVITKYALYGLVKSLAVEYAGKNITCNMISPDMMETKFLSELDKRTAEINAKSSAMKRNVSLDEVVTSMMHLLSDEAGYINGINLNISGGKFM